MLWELVLTGADYSKYIGVEEAVAGLAITSWNFY